MIISWPHPAFLDIQDNHDGNLTCLMKCENVTLTFQAPVAIGDYLNELKTNKISRLERIEGQIESIDNLFSHITLSGVKILAYAAINESDKASSDTH